MTPTETKHDAEADDHIHEELRRLRTENSFMTHTLEESIQEGEKLMAFIRDGAAFLRYATREGMSDAAILSTLHHDFMGLDNNERCFSPRVTGYAKLESSK